MAGQNTERRNKAMDKREIIEAIEHAVREMDRVSGELEELGKVQLSKKAMRLLWEMLELEERVERSVK